MTSKLKLLAVVVVLVGVAGCNVSSTALYAKKCVAQTSEVQEVGVEMAEVISPWLEGNTVELGKLEAQYKTIFAKFKRVKKDILSRKVPDNVNAKAFASGMKDFLDYEENMIEEIWNEVKRGVQTENPGSPQLRIEVATNIQAMTSDEVNQISKLNNLARKCGLTILKNNGQ